MFPLPDIDFYHETDVDIGPVHASVEAEFEIDGNDSQRLKQLRRRALIEHYAPRYIRYAAAIQAPASGAAFQFITDEPSDGRYLEIMRFHLDIQQPLTSSGAVAVEPTTLTIYLVADPGNAAGNPSQYLHSVAVIGRWTTLPIDQTWPSHAVRLNHPENLWIVVSNNAGSAVNLSGNLQTVNRPTDEWDDPTMMYHILNSFRDE